jgi:mono/diheme cytochrome c family protein
MNKIKFLALLIIAATIGFTSCYDKQYVLTPQPTVSFVNDVVPILTSSACGCHNNGLASANSPKHFSNLMKAKNGGDTIYYDAIYAEAGYLKAWVVDSTAGHPGGGNISLTQGEAFIIQQWFAQGAVDDYSSGGASGNISYAANIQPIINSVCSSPTCHGINGSGALGPALNYASLTGSLNTHLVSYLNNNWSGMAGATIPSNVTATIKAWVAQGMKP